jgi:hypothetical protein
LSGNKISQKVRKNPGGLNFLGRSLGEISFALPLFLAFVSLIKTAMVSRPKTAGIAANKKIFA